LKVAFFDRDGTIIEDYPDHEWTGIEHPIFIEGSINVLKEVIRKGYKIIIITNQYIINEGYITIDQYHDINNQMINEFKKQGIELLDVFYCPHSKNEGCTSIKPEIGMIMKAIDKYPEIKLRVCFMIGDSTVDVELAIKLGIKGFGIGVGSNYKQKNIHQLNTIKDLPFYI